MAAGLERYLVLLRREGERRQDGVEEVGGGVVDGDLPAWEEWKRGTGGGGCRCGT